jgi:DNA-binding NarL/FixJ family response regulator
VPSSFAELARQVRAQRATALGVDAICFVPVALALHAVHADRGLAEALADEDTPGCSRWLQAQYAFARGYCRTALGRADGAPELARASDAFQALDCAFFAQLASQAASGGALAAGRHGAAPAPAKRRGDGLTARELQIAKLVAEGKRNREIAQQLFLSERTVEVHLANVFGKLKITSRVQLARYMSE